MLAPFDLLSGPAGDVNELEYISALHQTDAELVREDASIRAEDIRLFLSSRYGIAVTEAEVSKTIVSGLATNTGASGACCDNDKKTKHPEVLDLMELVAILLIPTFLKAALSEAAQESEEDEQDPEMVELGQSYLKPSRTGSQALPDDMVPPPPGLLGYVLKMILHDVTGNHQPKKLTIDLIQRILNSYGECELAKDEGLMQEMVDAASGRSTEATETEYASMDPNEATESTETWFTAQRSDSLKQNKDVGLLHREAYLDTDEESQPNANTEDSNRPPSAVYLDAETFAQALTGDIRLYDISNEMRMTTHLDDVYGDCPAVPSAVVPDASKEGTVEDQSKDQFQAMQQTAQPVGEPLKRKITFPAIDLTAGTYRSKTLTVMLWATILITYFAYSHSYQKSYASKCEDEGKLFIYSYETPWSENKNAMACEAAFSILAWLEQFGSMCLMGIAYVALGSVGNSVECKQFWKPLIGSVFVLGLVFGPFLTVRQGGETTEKNILYVVALILGTVTACLHISHAAAILFSPATIDRMESYLPKLHKVFTGTVAAEKNSKKAAARKVARMTRNALDIVNSKERDNVLSTHYGQALGNYARSGKKYTKVGGFLWSWQCIGGRNQILARDGIRLPARMIAGNIAQYVVVLYSLFGGITLTNKIVANFDAEWAKQNFRDFIAHRTFKEGIEEEVAAVLIGNVTSLVGRYMTSMEEQGNAEFGCSSNSTASAEEILETYCTSMVTNISSATAGLRCDQYAPVNYLCPLLDPSAPETLNASSQQALLAASGFDQDLLIKVATDAVYQAAGDSVDSLYPSETYMVLVPMVIGVVLAFITTASLALMYIPSVTTTILKLRSGDIQTLHNKDFNRYRSAPDQVALLTGSLFWGTLVSGILVGGTVGLIVFFFLWQATAYYAQRFMAIIIGIISVTLFRLALVCICRRTLYKAFYRERPGIANVGMLALEWAAFALSVGFIAVRMVKLLLAAGMSVGRIDAPFLAKNAGRIGPVQLDNYPSIHLKDLLSHEAHRHPYIEQLGVIYLMKLRYASRFGKRAGTCWRLIFVYALMPWLNKYRLLTRPEQMMSRYFTSMDLERQYPSLRFVSLHADDAMGGGEEGDDEPPQQDKRTSTTGDGPGKPIKIIGDNSASTSQRRSIVRFEPNESCHFQDSSDDDRFLRIRQLENENKRLKEVLARQGAHAGLVGADC